MVSHDDDDCLGIVFDCELHILPPHSSLEAYVALIEALPQELQLGWAPTAADLTPAVLDAIRPGDVVMVKGSLGSRMGPVVAAIKKRFAPQERSV